MNNMENDTVLENEIVTEAINEEVLDIQSNNSAIVENSSVLQANNNFENNSSVLSPESAVNNYVCQDCKTTFTVKGLSTSCLFCGSNNIAKGEVVRLDQVFYLPFVKSIDDAVSDYKKHVRFNLLSPLSFRKKTTINRIRKVYIPGSLYYSKISGGITFYGADENIVNKAKETKKYEISYTTNLDYKNVFISNYSKINEDIFSDVLEYDYTNLAQYDDNILGDIACIENDINKSDIDTKLNNKLMKSSVSIVRENVPHQLKKLKENSMVSQTMSQKNILVPAYILDVKYKNKDYMYLMNGQNGKSSIDLEIGILNIILFSLLIFTIIFLIAFLIAYLV